MAFIIGICGGSGSGKSTLSNELERIFKDDLTRISSDSYCIGHPELSLEERAKINYDLPSSYELSLLEKHLDNLLNDKNAETPIYNFSNHLREDFTKTIKPNKIILVEGLFSFASPSLMNQYDLKIFVDASENSRRNRRMKRDQIERGRTLESIIKQLNESVIPMHDLYVEPTKSLADIIINNNDDVPMEIEFIISKIREMMLQKEDI